VRGLSTEVILMKQLVLSAVLLMVCCTLTFPAGQEPASPPKIPLALSISGGTSLGCYEAGYCYYATEWLKKNDSLFDLKVVTGTSAGSINALLTFLSMASSTPVFVPESSVFFKTWTNVDFSRIRGPETRLGVFGRMGLKYIASKIIPEARRNANHMTDRYLGITATHMSSYDEEIVPGLTIPTVKQHFVIHGTTDTHGTWTFLNHIDPESKLSTAVLPFKAGDTAGSDTILRGLVFASAGIPGLWQPYKIRHLQITPEELRESGIKFGDLTNDLYDSVLNLKHTQPFIHGIDPDTIWQYGDGGVLDNSPIRLATQIANSVFAGNAPRYDSAGVGRPQANPFAYFYLSAENNLYPTMQKSKSRDSLSVYNTLGNGLLDWTDAARQNELFTLKEEKQEGRLLLSRNYYPVYCKFMGALFGFFERDLRVFDFYLGMYDAQKYLLKDALDSIPGALKRRIGRPAIEDTTFGKICKVLDGEAPATYDNNLDRLTGLSRELYFWYWNHANDGIDQKRKCAGEFAAAISGAYYGDDKDRLKKILDTLQRIYSFNKNDNKNLVHLISSAAGRIPAEIPSMGKMKGHGKHHKGDQVKSETDVILDSVFIYMQKLNDLIASKQNYDPGKSLLKMFGYESPLCEHYLEEQYHQRILKQAKLPDPGSFSKHLADTSAKKEFQTVLNLMNDVKFEYSDLVELDKERHPDSASGRWATDGVKVKPKPMNSAEVNLKIKLALSKLLRDYGNESGGPELERNVVNSFGDPLLGLISNTPPRLILYGALAINGGEVGISLHKQWTMPNLPQCWQWLPHLLSPRYTLAVAIDSVALDNAQPAAQGLTMPYRGPDYVLGGLEWEVFREWWMQLRIGARFGRRFPGGENRIQLDPTLILLERLRIGLCVENRLFDNESFFNSLKSRGLMASFNIGFEIFSW
jgi:predicted acylesterase/phospholipase RssA